MYREMQQKHLLVKVLMEPDPVTNPEPDAIQVMFDLDRIEAGLDIMRKGSFILGNFRKKDGSIDKRFSVRSLLEEMLTQSIHEERRYRERRAKGEE